MRIIIFLTICKVQWLPFFLRPDLGYGIDKLEAYEQKFGADRVPLIIARMKEVGLQTEPPIHFSYGGKMSNTMRSHRLIHFSSKFGFSIQNDVVEALMIAYFEKEKDLGDIEVLIDSARGKLPVSDEDLLKYLLSDEDEDLVRTQARKLVASHQISGVPHFIVKGPKNSFTLGGAQEAAVFSNLFGKL